MDHLVLARLDPRNGRVARDILALQRRAYRLEADLIGFDEIPPLRETLAELQSCEESFLGAYAEGQLAGIVSWKREGDTLDIHRLAVDPSALRRGLGRTLVRAAERSEPDVSRAIVQTGAANAPARALYRDEGFAEIGEREVAPGLRVTLLEKRA
jgi:ribosomal protein S18 acetylase RimI-like enzyme